MIDNYGFCALNEADLATISGGNSEDIAQNLKTLRVTSHLSREELADKLNIDLSTLARYEVGNRIPSIDTIITIAKIFNTDVSNIIL
ncbi:helix-turn-helix transcriptional regulator [uncultured Leuconostoc sp.]|uniref:helix-turn-helix domain-containing protein n=1 Tax=uncultured Leuconostoc sp. TaxID=173262 RepID=UPI0025D60B55|nr:helix-turn-helix transcriptional regulator [uncultured Leuconostoc sp.]